MKTFSTKNQAISFFAKSMPRPAAVARVDSMIRAKSIRILEFELTM